MTSSRPNQQPGVQTPHPASQSPIQRWFRRIAWLASSDLGPGAQGTVDVSMPWPLKPGSIEKVFTSGLTPVVTIYAPKAGTHGLVNHLFATMGVAVAQTFNLELIDTTRAAAIITPLIRFDFGAGGHQVGQASIPLINARVSYFQAAAGDVVTLSGLDSIYVPHPFALQVTVSGGAGTIIVTGTVKELPETQPLSAILNLT